VKTDKIIIAQLALAAGDRPCRIKQNTDQKKK
jgi:hypothetical protein